MAKKFVSTSRKRSREDEIRDSVDNILKEAQYLVDTQPSRSLALCRDADELLCHVEYPQGTINSTCILASALLGKAEYTQALELLQGIADMCATHGSTHQRARYAHLMGTVLHFLSIPGKALWYIEDSIELYQQIDAPLDEARANLALGSVYLHITMYDKALERALLALETFQKFDNKVGIAKALNNIGSVHHHCERHEQALQFFHKSLEIKRETNDKKGEANTLNNIANILFWANREYDKALEYYNVSLVISRTHGYSALEAASLQHIGQIYTYSHQYDKAIQYGTHAVAISKETNKTHDTAYGLMDLGFVYIQADQPEKGIELIREGMDIAREIQANYLISKGCNLLRQIYREVGDFENATTYCEMYIDIQKQLFNENSDKRIQQLTIQFEVEKARQEKELYRLRAEKLEQDILYKEKELTTTAMYLTQKNEFLGKINRQIEKAIAQPAADSTILLCSLQQQIRDMMGSEKGWEYFEQQFNLVHQDFTQRLSELYPKLTPMELKVSTLLRLNLSTKEIANLLYQSPRSIEAYRYRLRQKMDLPADTHLSTFLASL